MQEVFGTARLVLSWGTEEGIIEAARMSTGKGFLGWDRDARLLEYLYRNEHLTPFEMCGMTVEVEAPIFVARQWMRHRTFSYNELSGRYVELPERIYQPPAGAIRRQGGANRQGSEEAGGDEALQQQAAAIFREANESALAAYRKLLALGVAREQARAVMPAGTFTRFRCSGNLRNWLHFVRLRIDSHAQLEIRHLATEVAGFIARLWPRTWELFRKYTLEDEEEGRCRRKNRGE